jgi:hypothetical protein
VRRFWIHHVLPTLLAALPALLAVLVFAAIPPDVRYEYLQRVRHHPIDWIILGLGFALFLTQIWLCRRALIWREHLGDFDPSTDRWLSHLAQGAEWFPLLGLMGTVIAILQTFSTITPGARPDAAEIIRKYAPAITATGGGLYMAFINILPSWVANVGRDLIRMFGGSALLPEAISVE